MEYKIIGESEFVIKIKDGEFFECIGRPFKMIKNTNFNNNAVVYDINRKHETTIPTYWYAKKIEEIWERNLSFFFCLQHFNW